MRIATYLLTLVVTLLPMGAFAQGTPPAVDEATRLEILGRLNQFLGNMDKINTSCTSRLPVSSDMQVTDSYLKMLDYRVRNLERNLKAIDVRWNNYYPTQQWEISQDEVLMAKVEAFELSKQEASDSLEVRKQMLQALHDFSDARTYMEGLDSTYNSLGKRTFQLSLTSKTGPLLEKQKMKEQLLFATVQEKFDKAREVEKYGLVSSKRMEELQDMYAVLKNKSDAIQAMEYKPLIQRIKDYLLGLAAVAVLLMAFNMLKAKIKAARQARENLKKYKDALHLNGQDEYPTI